MFYFKKLCWQDEEDQQLAFRGVKVIYYTEDNLNLRVGFLYEREHEGSYYDFRIKDCKDSDQIGIEADVVFFMEMKVV